MGIDAQVHRSSIEQNLPTVAVMAGGMDRKYPSANFKLFKQISNELDAPLFFADQETMEIPETIKLPSLQGMNLRTALCALNNLGVAISEQELIQSLHHLSKNTGLYGRLTKISEYPQIFVDVSHNKEGVSATMKALNDFSFDKLHIIYGASQDKNVEEIVGVFPEDAQIYIVTFSNNRSMEEQQMKEFMKKDARIQSVSTNVNTILESLRSSVSPKDFILVTGSFFLLSDLKHWSIMDKLSNTPSFERKYPLSLL